jgi:hypothetical protein
MRRGDKTIMDMDMVIGIVRRTFLPNCVTLMERTEQEGSVNRARQELSLNLRYSLPRSYFGVLCDCMTYFPASNLLFF